MSRSCAKKVIILKHSRIWGGDRCSALLTAKGYRVDWCYPMEGEALPDPRGYSGAIIFGGKNSVNDADEWIIRELRWVEQCLEAGSAFLGLCFGGQLLAKALGAEVAFHPEGLTEIGFTRIHPGEQADDLQPMPEKLFQWHREGFDLPVDCTLLASSERYPNQAFRYRDRFYGLQFHPEVTHAVIEKWFENNQDYHSEGLDPESRSRNLDYARRHDDRITEWFSAFLERWLESASDG